MPRGKPRGIFAVFLEQIQSLFTRFRGTDITKTFLSKPRTLGIELVGTHRATERPPQIFIRTIVASYSSKTTIRQSSTEKESFQCRVFASLQVHQTAERGLTVRDLRFHSSYRRIGFHTRH